jgi:hypothetical protein
MTTFVLAWVLVTFDSFNSGMQYSPPLHTLEDCKRLQEVRKQLPIKGPDQCVQLNVMRGTQR